MRHFFPTWRMQTIPQTCHWKRAADGAWSGGRHTVPRQQRAVWKPSQFSLMYIPICGFTYFLHISMGLWVKMFSIQAIGFSITHVTTRIWAFLCLRNSSHNLTWMPNQTKTEEIVIFFKPHEPRLAYLVWNRPNPCVPAFLLPSLAELTQTREINLNWSLHNFVITVQRSSHQWSDPSQGLPLSLMLLLLYSL